jgi:hypothetical protein
MKIMSLFLLPSKCQGWTRAIIWSKLRTKFEFGAMQIVNNRLHEIEESTKNFMQYKESKNSYGKKPYSKASMLL